MVLQTVPGDGRVGNDHYGLFRGIFSGLAPGQHGVGWVDGEAVVTLGPPLKEPATAGPCVLFIDPLGRPLSPVSVVGVRRRDMRRERRR